MSFGKLSYRSCLHCIYLDSNFIHSWVDLKASLENIVPIQGADLLSMVFTLAILNGEYQAWWWWWYGWPQVRIEYASLLGTRDEHIFLFDRTGDHQYSATSLYEVSEQCKGYVYWDLNPHLERGECIASLLTQKRPVLKAVEVFD